MTTADDKVRYRWECRTHGQVGRWLTDPNGAGHYAMLHWDRRGGANEAGTCVPRLVDNTGIDHGPAV